LNSKLNTTDRTRTHTQHAVNSTKHACRSSLRHNISLFHF